MREWLRELRLGSNMTVSDMADKLGISQQYYSYIELGQRKKELDINTVLALSNIFGVSVAYIIEAETSKS